MKGGNYLQHIQYHAETIGCTRKLNIESTYKGMQKLIGLRDDTSSGGERELQTNSVQYKSKAFVQHIKNNTKQNTCNIFH